MYKIETIHDLTEYLLKIPNQNMSIKFLLRKLREDLLNNEIKLVGDKNE